jgi:hypothetical protein
MDGAADRAAELAAEALAERDPAAE